MKKKPKPRSDPKERGWKRDCWHRPARPCERVGGIIRGKERGRKLSIRLPSNSKEGNAATKGWTLWIKGNMTAKGGEGALEPDRGA